MSEMERNPDFPTSTRDEVLFIPVAMHEESQEIPRSLLELERVLDTLYETPEDS